MTIEDTTERASPPISKGWLSNGLTTLFSGTIWTAFYFGTGAFCHVQFYRRDFAVTDLLSWGWLLAWPVGLLLKAAVWIMWGCAILLGVILALVAGYFLWRLAYHLWWMWVGRPRFLRRCAAERQASEGL